MQTGSIVTSEAQERGFFQDIGCSFFAYSWKLPAYSALHTHCCGPFPEGYLRTLRQTGPGPNFCSDNFSFSTYSWSFFAYSLSFSTYSWSFFAYSGKVLLIRALRDCKQRSLTVSKKDSSCKEKSFPLFQGELILLGAPIFEEFQYTCNINNCATHTKTM